MKSSKDDTRKTIPRTSAVTQILLPLFMFNFWNATGLLPMTQALVIGLNGPHEE